VTQGDGVFLSNVMNFMHTKKFALSTVITFTLFFFAGIVASAFAQTTTSATPRGQSQAEVTERKEERIAARKELQAQRKTRIVNLCANMSNRFEAVVNRLQTIATRIDSRIAKLEGEGRDITAAKNAVADARVALKEATAALATIDETVNVFVTSEDPQAKWSDVRKTFVSIHKNLMDARQSLRTAIGALKPVPEATRAEEVRPSVVSEGQPSAAQ
jgi:hypothetical protein